jgi:hypothetical protein
MLGPPVPVGVTQVLYGICVVHPRPRCELAGRSILVLALNVHFEDARGSIVHDMDGKNGLFRDMDGKNG